MFHVLKRHPWPITAHFDWSLALVFAIPKNTACQLMLPGLEPDLFGEWGFIAAAFVRTHGLKPDWAPRWMAQDFFLAGWRVFARARLSDGRTVRGLRILGSDTDSWIMTALGGLLTHYDYRKVGVQIHREEFKLGLRVRHRGEITVDFEADLHSATMPPPSSPFPDLRTARRFAGPMPFTFSYEQESDSLVIVEGSRQHWEPRPVSVDVRRLDFFARSPFAESGLPPLANAFWVEDVSYAWKRGVLAPLRLTESSHP